jgi:hypothetical protein
VGQIPRRAAAVVIAILVALAPASALLVAAESPPLPVAAPDSYAATEDQVLVVDAPGVLANDNPGPTSCVVVVALPLLNGTVELRPDGSFTYTPPANFNGETSFGYALRVSGDEQCSGPAAGDSEATVTITVGSVNDPPTATADSFTALTGRTLNVSAPGVLLNDHDADGDTLTSSVVNGVSHGTLVLASNGAFSYTPAGGYHGADGFSYRASDGTATSPTRVVTLSVVAIPTPAPTAAPTDTPIPTAEPTLAPTPEATVEPTLPAATLEPPSFDPGAPTDTFAPTALPSALPGSSLAPEPTAGSGSGPSLPALLVIVLLAVLLAFGAAIYVPRWLRTARTGEPPDDEA